MSQSRLQFLFQKYLDSASQPEINEFLLLIKDSSDEEILALLEEISRESDIKKPFFNEDQAPDMLKAIFSDEQVVVDNKRRAYTGFAKRKPVLKYVAIAALLFIGISVGVWVNNEIKDEISIANIDQQIKPGSDKATLELGDGSLIDLTKDLEGAIFEKNGLVISKTKDGQIVYKAETLIKENPNDPIAYNTIRTPKGGQFQIILPDGSKVWLNAASSLTYPAAFEGTERKVTLEGEGYFDVAKDVSKPFEVISRGQTVTVLGTQFNINSYGDEPLIKTTLIEGSVKITEDVHHASVILNPGEQAIINHANKFEISQDHQDEAIAWRNGFFRFQGAEIDQVMRELSRWYNVDIEIEDEYKGLQFWGEIYRNGSISDALEILSYFNLSYKIAQTNNGIKIIIHK